MRFPFGRNRLSRHSSVSLTEAGKSRVEEFECSGASYFILNYLDEHGASTIGEMSERLEMDGKVVTQVVTKLVKSGAVKETEHGEEVEP